MNDDAASFGISARTIRSVSVTFDASLCQGVHVVAFHVGCANSKMCTKIEHNPVFRCGNPATNIQALSSISVCPLYLYAFIKQYLNVVDDDWRTS